MAVYSIIKKSELGGDLRLDAEYYQPEYLNIISKLKSQNSKSVGELTSDIRYGLYVEPDYLDEGVNFIRAMNLLDFGISGEILKIDENKVPRDYRLKTSDSLIIRSGANTGYVGLVYPRMQDASFGSYTIRLRFNKINPFFASIFLNTKYGRLQTERLQTGMAQPNLNIPNIKEIIIPMVSEEKQKAIENICIEFEKISEQAENFYSQAEGMLLKELGLENFEEQDDLFSIVKFSDIKKFRRMDAEYFQPKYEKLISRIKQGKTKLLDGFVKEYSTGYPFKSENYQEQGIPLIRINNIKKGFIDLSGPAYLSEKDYLLSKKDIAKPGDIVLSMSGTIGVSAVIPDDIKKCSVNQRILKITPKDIEKNYFTLLLNSIVGIYQLERIGTGGVQTNISYKDIKNLLVPILPQQTQQKIAELVQKSHQGRQKAKELLAQAQQKVENLIEK